LNPELAEIGTGVLTVRSRRFVCFMLKIIYYTPYDMLHDHTRVKC